MSSIDEQNLACELVINNNYILLIYELNCNGEMNREKTTNFFDE